MRKLHLEINGLARPRRARAALEGSGERSSAIAVLIRCVAIVSECAARSALPVFHHASVYHAAGDCKSAGALCRRTTASDRETGGELAPRLRPGFERRAEREAAAPGQRRRRRLCDGTKAKAQADREAPRQCAPEPEHHIVHIVRQECVSPGVFALSAALTGCSELVREPVSLQGTTLLYILWQRCASV